MFDISPVQILIVLVIALLVFGPRRLPELARGIGRGVREFKDGINLDDAPDREPPGSRRAVIAPPHETPAAAAASVHMADDDDAIDRMVVRGDDQPPAARG